MAKPSPLRDRPADELAFGDLKLDLVTYRVYRRRREVVLGPTELRLLQSLLAEPRRVFTREQILATVWRGSAEIDPRTVDVHIARLRKALTAAGEPDLIRTVRTIGYALDRSTRRPRIRGGETYPIDRWTVRGRG